LGERCISTAQSKPTEAEFFIVVLSLPMIRKPAVGQLLAFDAVLLIVPLLVPTTGAFTLPPFIVVVVCAEAVLKYAAVTIVTAIPATMRITV
jgi:hypothetical protein